MVEKGEMPAWQFVARYSEAVRLNDRRRPMNLAKAIQSSPIDRRVSIFWSMRPIQSHSVSTHTTCSSGKRSKTLP